MRKAKLYVDQMIRLYSYEYMYTFTCSAFLYVPRTEQIFPSLSLLNQMAKGEPLRQDDLGQQS